MDNYLQYGCGLSAPAGWDNYDASPTLRLQRIPLLGSFIRKVIFPKNVKYGDIVRGLTSVEPGSCKGIYCSHVLEHLSLEDMRTALRNTYSLLMAGGLFRCVLPDLEHSINIYIEEKGSMNKEAAVNFMKNTMLGTTESPKTLKDKIINLFGNSHHLWMWDLNSLKAELLKAGFKNVRQCNYNDSSDARFKEVEDSSRFYGAIAFECIK